MALYIYFSFFYFPVYNCTAIFMFIKCDIHISISLILVTLVTCNFSFIIDYVVCLQVQLPTLFLHVIKMYLSVISRRLHPRSQTHAVWPTGQEIKYITRPLWFHWFFVVLIVFFCGSHWFLMVLGGS